MKVGAARHWMTLENPGPEVPDGAGGFTETPVPLSPPAIKAAIYPATARDLERLVANTAQSAASHIIVTRYHSGITTKTRIRFNGRTFHVEGVQNVEERNRELRIAAVEVVA